MGDIDTETTGHLGLVLECDVESLTIYRERCIYKVPRTEKFVNTGRADWVIFWIKNNEVELFRPYNKKKWNARVNPDGDILLDVNAQLRCKDNFPIVRRPGIDLPVAGENDVFRTPWSFELDWLEDPTQKMKDVRKSWFHEVTVKFIHQRNNSGDDIFKFPVQEVHYESPTDIQLLGAYTPWIEELIATSRPAPEASHYQSVAERDVQKVHKKNHFYGIVVKKAYPAGFTYVWSLSTGEHTVRREVTDRNPFYPGQFVFFKLKHSPNTIYVNRIEKAPTNVKKTDCVQRSADEKVARVLIDFPVPAENLVTDRRLPFSIYDNFLGHIEVSQQSLARMLGKHSLTIPEVFGRLIKMWVMPNIQVARNRSEQASKYWEPIEIHDDVFSNFVEGDPVRR